MFVIGHLNPPIATRAALVPALSDFGLNPRFEPSTRNAEEFTKSSEQLDAFVFVIRINTDLEGP